MIRGQAQWAEEARDWKAAAEMYRESGDIIKSVEIFGERGWFEELMELCQVRVIVSKNVVPYLILIRDWQKQSMQLSRKLQPISVKVAILNMLLMYPTTRRAQFNTRFKLFNLTCQDIP